MSIVFRNICASVMGLLFAGAALNSANAADALPEPYQTVQSTTEQVLAIIREGKSYYDKDPARFNKQVEVVLDKVVDFRGFARGVMGPYANNAQYVQPFSDTFKQGLIETYAKGLLKFNGQKIETLPPRKADDIASGKVEVLQNIYGSADKPYVVQYTMRNRDGAWKLQNVIIEGINLGLTYRNQFAAAADQYHGDLEKVIATWHVEPQIDAAKDDDASSKDGKAKSGTAK